MNKGDLVRIPTGHFGLIVSVDLIESHSGVTVAAYCTFCKETRPQWFLTGQLKSHGDKQQSLADDLEEIIANETK
jgi:hypothetical protein